MSATHNRKPAKSRASKRRLRLTQENRLSFQQLEDRQLLAAITVSNNSDVISPTADTSSIMALQVNDGGDGISLREAIAASNNTAGADTVTFDGSVFTGGAASLIRLTQGELEITEDLSIDGSMGTDIVITADANGDDVTLPGTFITDVDASFIESGPDAVNLLSDNSRVIRFRGSLGTYDGSLALSDLTITGGSVSNGRGGGIVAQGLTLTNSQVRGNSTTGAGGGGEGGGILGSRIWLTDSVVSDNRTFGFLSHGGGILVSGGEITLQGSMVSGNSTFGDSASGGGIFSSRSNITLIDSTIVGNSTNGRFSVGGGIRQSAGSVDVTNSTISGNQTQLQGGGITTSGGAISLINSTISGNTVVDGGGGGVRALASEVFVVNSTISGNSAGSGGGLLALDEPAVKIVNSTVADNAGGGIRADLNLEISNSIVAGNIKNGVPTDFDFPLGAVPALTVDHSLIGDTTGSGIDSTTGTGNILNQPALLGPLADNGGPTLTHALLPSSPAIDAGSNALAVNQNGFPLVKDQRGFGRIVDGDTDGTATVDIGAYELGGTSPLEFPVITSISRDEGGELARPDLLSTFSVSFDVDVSVGLDDLVIRNDTLGGTVVDSSGVTMVYDDVTHTATWDFSSLILDPAFYSFELSSDIVSVEGSLGLDGDFDGTPGGNHVESIYVAIPGDANLDGVVDVLGDAFTLVGSLNSTTNVAWADGNFNGDGVVNVLGDAFVLVGNLNRDVRPPVAAASFGSTQSLVVSTSSDISAATLIPSSDADDQDKTIDEATIASPLSQSPTLALAGDHELRDDVFGNDY